MKKNETEEYAVMHNIIQVEAEISQKNSEVFAKIEDVTEELKSAQKMQTDVLQLLSKIEHIFLRETDDIDKIKHLLNEVTSQRQKILDNKKLEINDFVNEINQVMNKKILDNYVNQISNSSIALEASAKMLTVSAEKTRTYFANSMQQLQGISTETDKKLSRIRAYRRIESLKWALIGIFSGALAMSIFQGTTFMQ